MSVRHSRLFDERNVLENRIILTMMHFLFKSFYWNFDLCAKVIVSLTCWTCSTLISSKIGTDEMRVFLFYFLDVWSFHASEYFWTNLLRARTICLAIAVIFFMTFSVPAESCVKWHLLMVESLFGLMNPATGRMNNGWEAMRFTTAFINVSNCDHLSKHCKTTSLAAVRVKNVTTIVYSNGANVVLILFNVALMPNWSILMRVFSVLFCAFAWVRFA